MTRRQIAWLIFLGFLALLGGGASLGAESHAIQYGIWGLWLVFSAAFVWVYARTGSSTHRLRLIDTRGINLLPQPLRRWLFDE
jgi:hypothetical protein